MNIRIKNLTITEYDELDKRKIRFIKDIKEDQLVGRYVSNTMDEWLEDSRGLDKLLVGPAYIISDKRKLVGFIRMASLNKNGEVDLHYGVHPDFRKQGYGSKILLEVSNYLLKNTEYVKRIKLDIKEENKGSILCAENANFTLYNMIKTKQDGNVLVYIKK